MYLITLLWCLSVGITTNQQMLTVMVILLSKLLALQFGNLGDTYVHSFIV